ncbi:adenylate/guanylate cyclase domain-containing protein [Aquibium carbonis]|uniref:Adenylate/guanylate cyclase domain-containing protein n=1 Tax=Aquibium carbonis TaxID=2495581 RepID=A0A3R9YBA7_9HYPH|nr:adenylate/guanylate cyclase domain-containing protein [Aquibium carbonis]RST87338.1 adenylate/guanylate cyclase domain-containing protein [Aquibium carbonis]
MLVTPKFDPVAERPGVDHRQIYVLVAWLVDGARSSTDARSFVEEVCRRLLAAGVPLDRVGLFINTLHPNVAARRFLWTSAEGVTMQEGPISLFSPDQHLENPLPLVTSRQTSVRRMLTSPASLTEFTILADLREEGFTDYLAQPLIFTTGETHAATFATRHAAGFTGDQLAALERVRQPLARVVEAYLLRMNAACIISTYVGRGSGNQILQGRIRRGDGEEIAAAILFADLIGFTELSNQLTGEQMVETLNDAFDVVVPLVEANGGEILKFLGDGFFAIFPYGGSRLIDDAVRSARQTIMEGEERLARAPVGRDVAFRWALHAGRFHYGNIGGANRLDFTAIGRPVNYAARLLAAASDLSLKHVASGTVAEYLCTMPRVAAEVEFKGFEGKQKIYRC